MDRAHNPHAVIHALLAARHVVESHRSSEA
jgi:hypothetical protein